MGIEEFLIERAKREGREEGREEGVELANRNNARRLKELGVSYEIIAASTGLSLEDIEKL